MNRKLVTLAALAAAALAGPSAAAHADTLLAPAPNATSLAMGGGVRAWLARSADGSARLVVRRSDGTIRTPAIAPLAPSTQLSVGSAQGPDGTFKLVVAYARADGDLHQLDLRTETETRIARLSTPSAESAVSVSSGNFAFVRRGARAGVYVAGRRGAAKRIARDAPAILVTGGSRIAYVKGRSIVVRRASGRGPAQLLHTRSAPSAVALLRTRVAWLEPARKRLVVAPISDARTVETTERSVPATTRAFAVSAFGSALTYLDGQGVKLSDVVLR